MRGKTAAIAAAVAVGVAVAGGGLYGVHRAYAVHQACDSIRAYEDSTGPVQRIGASSTRYAVLGDSYSTGDLLQDRRDAWTYALSATHDVQLDVVAQGGTGYVNEGFCGDGSYEHRANAVPDDDSPLIIEGGLNDLQSDPNQLRSAADRLVGSIADKRPVILIGPVDTPAEDGEKQVDRTLAEVAAKYDVTYISGMDWDIDFGPDGKHMSPAGHAAFAKHIEDALAL